MAVRLAQGESIVFLQGVSRAGFDAIVGALPESGAARLAYDGETVEIMAPYAEP